MSLMTLWVSCGLDTQRTSLVRSDWNWEGRIDKSSSSMVDQEGWKRTMVVRAWFLTIGKLGLLYQKLKAFS